MKAMRQSVPDEDTWPLPEQWQTRLGTSWLRLFDLDLPACLWDPEALGEYGSREAVLGLLQIEDVRLVARFFGCSKR
jgi:hypothetical protein